MNLVWRDRGGVSIAYSRREPRTLEIEQLAPGIHVLGNDRLGTDGFLRCDRLCGSIQRAVAGGATWPAFATSLAVALGDHTRASLEATPPSHLPPELARELTATCIHSEHYGTRSSTILAVTRDRVILSACRQTALRHACGLPEPLA
jgi:uncharacterized protein with NRDE domain